MHGKYGKPKPFGEIEDGKAVLLKFNEQGEVEGVKAEDMRFWVQGRDGKYYELKPRGGKPTAEKSAPKAKKKAEAPKAENPKKKAEAPKKEAPKKGVFDAAEEAASEGDRRASLQKQAQDVVGKKRKVSLWDFNKKNSTYNYVGVYYKDGYAYSSNTFTLLKTKADYPAEWEGTFRDKKGDVVKAKLLPYESVIPKGKEWPKVLRLPSKGAIEVAQELDVPVRISDYYYEPEIIKPLLNAVSAGFSDVRINERGILMAYRGDEIAMPKLLDGENPLQSAAERYADKGLTKEQYKAYEANMQGKDTAVERPTVTAAEMAAANRTDKQGNPVDENGKLVTEKAERIEDLTDEDFTAPTRSVTLPTLPKLVDDAIGAKGKPVVIKKNIFGKNKKHHKDLTPAQSREILNNALYRPDLYGQNKKKSRPYNWILINSAEKHSSVILEVNHGKDNLEIVNWHYLDDDALKQKEKQAVKEGGLILTLKSAVGDTHDGLSENKGSEVSEKKQEKGGGKGAKPSGEAVEIVDVGEKIGGAKKDKYAAMAEQIKKGEDEIGEQLSKFPAKKVFSVFDEKTLRESGVSNEAVSLIMAVKKTLKSKPRTAIKMERWRRLTAAKYELCHMAMEDWNSAKSRLESPYATQLAATYNAIMAVGGFDGGMEIGDALLTQYGEDAKMFKDGKEYPLAGQWRLAQAGKYSGTYATYEDAAEALRGFAGENAAVDKTGKRKDVKLAVWSDVTGGIFIAPRHKSDIVLQDGFKSSEEACTYLREHEAEMQERYRNLMEDTKTERKENRPRVGRDYRAGKDVQAEEFRETFGFRGVEFGNWTNQSDRQNSLNEAYDALMDLASVCGVSPKALSLDGKLGIAFGARGGGKFNAHYELGKVVINLTKTKGAGSLAHEWFHALGHYFAGNGRSMTTSAPYLAERKEMQEAWKELKNKILHSEYYQRSMRYARLHSSDYWTKSTELGARAFSTWVVNQLSRQGTTNDYLANELILREDEATDSQKKYNVYPMDKDADWMDEAFGGLFSTMQERVDESTGNHILYRDGEDDLIEDNAIEKIVADAKKQGTYMLAPNGKRTNLDESQWVKVRTKNFKDWFGDWENDPENASKIVDENGEPMVVYHDTNSTTLVNRKTGQNFNDLSSEERYYWQTEASAREFEDTWEERPFYTFDNKNYGRRSIEMPAFFFTPIYDEYHEYGDRTIAVFLNVRNPIENPDIPNAGVTNTAGEDAMKKYIEMGYDGFIRKYDGVVEETNAFFPNQIKSAVENDGSYSPKDNDIRRSARSTGESSEENKDMGVSSREAALRDALVERMRKAGLDVSMDVEEGQRVLDEENRRVREHRGKPSDAAKKRNEILRDWDRSVASVIGRDSKEVGEERKRRFNEYKEETKNLYDRVLSGNFDEVTLQAIDDYIDKATPLNRYGRPIYQRLPQRVGQKVHGGERTGRVDALISRISESAVRADGETLSGAGGAGTVKEKARTPEEKARAVEDTKRRLLKGWAIATGNWHTDISDFADTSILIGRGKDSDVYESKDGKHVIKVSKGKPEGKRFRPDIDDVALFNAIFPNCKYTIVGYGEIDGKFVRFLQQPMVDFKESKPLTVEERVAYMKKLGFEPINKEKTAFSNGEIVASDLQKNNIVKDGSGNVRVIDADMKLHTKDVGGKYTYPDVETDLPAAKNDGGSDGIRFFRTPDGEAYGFTVGGKIFIDPRIATSETPIHEHSHLWGDMLRRTDPKLWAHLVKELKGSHLWEKVKENYPKLKTDEIADETFATFSGRRGSEKLRKEMDEILNGDGSVTEKAAALSALERVKKAISDFWRAVLKLFGINRYYRADELADMALKDLLEGKNPLKDETAMERGEVGKSLATSGSYFSGGGLLEEGLKGLIDPKVAVEYSEKIAGVYSDNHGNHIVVADVRDVDPKQLVSQVEGGEVQYFHASPVCKNFSSAKQNGGEVELDMETAKSTAEFIAATRPKVVTIENVKRYKNSEALKLITDELTRQGYDWDADVYKDSDFGGYTKRERLIVRAKRDGKLPPKPTKVPEELRKQGWMSAVEDLIPTLEEKRGGLSPSTEERLKNSGIDWRTVDKPLYVLGRGNADRTVSHAYADEVLPTLTTGGGDVIVMPGGKVLKVSPRVLARVTGLSDDYKMPPTDKWAHTIIGNGIPARMTEHVIGPLIHNAIPASERATQRRESVFDAARRVSEADESKSVEISEREKQVAELNGKFNEELKQQIKGELKEGHVYQLGTPSEVLLSTGFPNIPIELSALQLAKKANKNGHQFDLSDVESLPQAIQHPIAVFKYGDKTKSQNLIVAIEKDGKNFVVGIHFNQSRRGLVVNDIRGLFPKDNAEWLNWISKDRHLYVDKEKVQALIDKQRTNLAEVKYLDLDDVTNEVEKFENPKYSDGNFENEDKNLKSKEAMADEMAARVDDLSKKLNTPVRIVRTDEEVEALPTERQRRQKGSYNTRTGEVTIVVPNNANLADVENTFMHEVVGHDGLRVLFPEKEKLDNALDELYGASNDSIKATIDRRAQKMYDAEVERLLGQKRSKAEARAEADRKRDQFKRDATEEYGADLAGRIGEEGFEKMSAEEKTFWGKLKAVLQKALDALLHGLKIPGKRKWGDKDWAYVLHESYKRKKNGGRPSVFDVADTETMREKTGFGGSTDNGVMFRDGSPVTARDRYEKKVKSSRFQAREALQDSMLGLKTMMESVMKTEGKKRVYIEDIPDFENPYLGENRLSSVNQAQQKRAGKELFLPVLKEMRKLTGQKSRTFGRELEQEDLTDYMFAKHGLERDDVLRKRGAHEQYEKYKKTTPNGTKTEADFYNKLLNKDYAGLTELMKDDINVKALQDQIDQLTEQRDAEKDPTQKARLTRQINNLEYDIMYVRRQAAANDLFLVCAMIKPQLV